VTVTVKVASTAIATITTDGTVPGATRSVHHRRPSSATSSCRPRGHRHHSPRAKAAGFADGRDSDGAAIRFIINSPGTFTTAGAGNSNTQIPSVRLN
jgi:hypothetical protein